MFLIFPTYFSKEFCKWVTQIQVFILKKDQNISEQMYIFNLLSAYISLSEGGYKIWYTAYAIFGPNVDL